MAIPGHQESKGLLVMTELMVKLEILGLKVLPGHRGGLKDQRDRLALRGLQDRQVDLKG